MPNATRNLAFVALIPMMAIFLSFQPATEAGIKCWVCNSFNDLGCGDPFDNSSFPITDCDAETGKRTNLVHLNGRPVKATMCRKIVQKVNGHWRFIRSCAFLGEPGIGGDERFCKRRMGTNDIYQEDCLCSSKDGCNSAPLIGQTITLILTMVTISSFLRIR